MLSKLRPSNFLKLQKPSYSTEVYSDNSGLKERMNELIPSRRAEVKKIRKEFGDKVIDSVTIDQVYTGMRSLKAIVWEPSILDAESGILYQGHSIADLQQKLPKFGSDGEQPMAESLVWFLFSGEIPTKEQALSLQKELCSRAHIPEYTKKLIEELSRSGVHPMTQLICAVSSLQAQSQFAKKYIEGIHKNDLWIHTFEDAITLIAKMPEVCARIYANTFKNGVLGPLADPSLDYVANFMRRIGYKDQRFDEYMRLYMMIHADHEGGNVSAHTSHVVGSAYADPFLSFTAGMCGLAGPLHGLANQEVIRWVKGVQKKVGSDYSLEQIKECVWETLNSGKVVPGYGHAVLRRVDPRYTSQQQFALKYFPDDPFFKLIDDIYKVTPDILKQHGKTKNPWPNVDAHSGCMLMHYGLMEFEYYTVLFGFSRAFGIMSGLIWDRALGLSIERPKSVNTEWIKENVVNLANRTATSGVC
ncbi:citrate synthase, mitochondrial-like [Schistocerca gregaria]|uniref:citrate synthase, mitochondrial-like n=1 Tax=Schistocerca gregaria TaxID=7010 RepID=UPI00211DE5C1|nr:citrate synthase, mitochondrial-like [Schistocerca gregaria]